MNWIKNNPAATSLMLLTGLTFIFLGVMQGCDLREMTSLDVPPSVAQVLDPDAETHEYTLADADRIVTDWQQFVNTATRQLEASIDDANERHAVLASVVDLGVATVNEVAPTLPGGAFLVGGLSLLTGIFLKRPGEDKRVAAEKEDSYNAGIELGKKIAEEIKKA